MTFGIRSLRQVGRSFLYSLATISVITYYGIEVCPFLEGLSAGKLFTVLLFSTAASHFIHFLAVRFYFHNRAHEFWHTIALGVGSKLSVGIFSGSWNAVIYDFPLMSGLKLVGGYFILSLIATCLKVLDADHDLMTTSKEWSKHSFFPHLSLTKKFTVFTFITCACTCAILSLLLYRDFNYIQDAVTELEMSRGGADLSILNQVAREAFIEIAFVFGVLLGGILVIVTKYVRNVNIIFDRIHKAFDQIRFGNFDYQIPVLKNDELGKISVETNNVMASLREKEEIRTLFGKYISPEISKMILKRKDRGALGGEEVEVVVMFSDLRGFTSFSESHSAKEVVQVLNQYFSKVVKSVVRHGGVLDKFIGDAVMVVYGLGGREGSSLGALAHSALQTALEIQEILEPLNRELNTQGFPSLQSGVGIHLGRAIAGNIGSPDRMEYTVIGDTVNTASRLEGLSKKLGSSIVVSDIVYSFLSHEDQIRAVDLDFHKIRGKGTPVHLYGYGVQADGTLRQVA